MYLTLDEEIRRTCIAVINFNKVEFEDFLKSNLKLVFVKRLKELTSYGLKECKYIADSYFDGSLKITQIREERQQKLERLAKKPLIDILIDAIKNTDVETLHTYMMNLTIDQLLSLDEVFPNKEEDI